MVNHLMVDLETLGTKPGSAILSIGAVLFDPHGKLPKNVPEKKCLYHNAEIKTSIAAGFTFEQETVDWWLTQPKEAQEKLKVDKISIQKALLELRLFYSTNKCVCIWSHGSDFDVVLLQEGYRKIDMRHPWERNAVRDVRTTCKLAGVNPDGPNPLSHDALQDAIGHARAVQQAFKTLKIAKEGE